VCALRTRIVDDPAKPRRYPVSVPDKRPKTLFVLPFSVTPSEYQMITENVAATFPEEPVVATRPIPRLGDQIFYFLAQRTFLPVMPEREDLISDGFIISPNAAGVKLISGVQGLKIKIFKWGYHSTVDGQHFFYFGTSTTAPTLGTSQTKKVFGVSLKTGHYRQTSISPDVSGAGDDLYFYSANAESNMSVDFQYVQE
jgi:hypothetical protein